MSDDDRHDPTFSYADRVGVWVECSCGTWVSRPHPTLTEAATEHDEHLADVAWQREWWQMRLAAGGW